MKQKIIARGAEAIILQTKNGLIKRRVPKTYRHPQLDEKLRTQRTRHEARLLEKVRLFLPTPEVKEVNEAKKEIVLESIKGKKLANTLETLEYKKIASIIGKNVAILHDNNIIHGDLTTSNMLFHNKQVYLIDFGLGFHSTRIEDKAVDLHVLKEALEAKHPTIAKPVWTSLVKGYKHSKNAPIVLKQLERVEKRGRYKSQY